MNIDDAIKLFLRKNTFTSYQKLGTKIIPCCAKNDAIPELVSAITAVKKILDPFFSFLFKPNVETLRQQLKLLLSYIIIAQFSPEDQAGLLKQLHNKTGYFRVTSHLTFTQAHLLAKLVYIHDFKATIIPDPEVKKSDFTATELLRRSVPVLILKSECAEREIDCHQIDYDPSLSVTTKKLSLTMKFGSPYKFRQNDFLIKLFKNSNLKILDIDENSFDELTEEEWQGLSVALKKSNVILVNVMMDKKFNYLPDFVRKDLANVLNLQQTNLLSRKARASIGSAAFAHR